MARVGIQEYCEEARGRINARAYDEAITICRHILLRYPKHVRTYQILGEACLEKGDLNEAADIFTRLLAHGDPENLAAFAGLGVIYEEQGRIAEAVWYTERAFELASKNDEVRNRLRRLYGKRDGIEPERIKLNKAALARLYTRGGQYRQAIDELRRLLEAESDRDRLDLKVALVETLWRDGRREQAAELARQVLEVAPDCLKAILLLGIILLEKGRAQEGQAVLARARGLDPENRMANSLFGEHSPLPMQTVYIPRVEELPSVPTPVPVPAPTVSPPEEGATPVAPPAAEAEALAAPVAASPEEASIPAAAPLNLPPDGISASPPLPISAEPSVAPTSLAAAVVAPIVDTPLPPAIPMAPVETAVLSAEQIVPVAEPTTDSAPVALLPVETMLPPAVTAAPAEGAERPVAAASEAIAEAGPVPTPEAVVPVASGPAAPAAAEAVAPTVEVPAPPILTPEAASVPTTAAIASAAPAQETAFPNTGVTEPLAEAAAAVPASASPAESAPALAEGQLSQASAVEEVAPLAAISDTSDEPSPVSAQDKVSATPVPLASVGLSMVSLQAETERLQTVLEQKPKDDDARLALARAFRDQEQMKLALEQYGVLAHGKPKLLTAMVQDMESIVASRPDNLEAHELLADLYVKGGQLQKAVERYRWILQRLEQKPS